MINIAICDNNILFLDELISKVSEYIHRNKLNCNILKYQNSNLLLFDMKEKHSFDLLLIDIEVSEISGIEIAKYAKSYLPNILIIFLSTRIEYIVESFELSIFRFIPKNLLDIKLDFALNNAISLIKIQWNDIYIIKNKRRYEKIFLKDILYIHKDGKNSIINLSNGTHTFVRKSLCEVYNEINTHDFIYIDRGCIINLNHVVKMEDGIVVINNEKCLQVSFSRINEVKKYLMP